MDLLQGLLSRFKGQGEPIPEYLYPASMGGLLPNPPPVPFSADESSPCYKYTKARHSRITT